MAKSNGSTQSDTQANPEQMKLNLSNIKNSVVVMSGKGGVGKTTVASNLAMALAVKGYKVGLLDVDIHGPNVPKMLGVEDQTLISDEEGIIPVLAHSNLKVISMAYLLRDKDVAVIWRGPMKMAAIKQFLEDVKWGELDFLVIDLPPGTGDEPLTIAQQIPGAHAIIVTTPQDVALLDSRRSVNFAKQLGMNVLGIVENMSGWNCPHCNESIDLFKQGGGKKAASDLNVPFLGSLPIEPEIVLSGDSGQPFIISNPDSPSAKSFEKIVDHITEVLTKSDPSLADADLNPTAS